MLASTTRIGLGFSRKNLIQASRSLSFIKTIPQPPGHIIGTVNDAYVPPKPNKLHGSIHWTAERIAVLGMTPLIIAPFITGTSPLDGAMAGLLLYHCYAGFQSCIIDYIPRRVYGSLHYAAMYLLAFGSAVSAYGIYKIENEEKDGVWGVLKKLWAA
ncbi:membrane anchor subunit of succinate dehydrogenase, Sdh4 [Pichia californica]|uniref:Succinate dehydrogenase [ubiquinone] cytochrome b small subunit n=1 Tax=Pichia californica TaxID=460514 RepID=A0A9P6WNJ0_9ASCO|nr:membrane anchor subunit of succinate dehydrogenase, Sdh4 [[Candida] californica]KAG0690366.1 membrane anchor subunit of succinate dehydrogenase, Sdh4 [[Candida] californica]